MFLLCARSLQKVKVVYTAPKYSKVSRILTDMTTKRVILLVLILVFVMPLLSVEYYFEMPSEIDMCVRQMLLVS